MSLLHLGTILHGVTSARRVTFAQVENLAQQFFCTSVTLAQGDTFAQVEKLLIFFINFN